MYWRQYEAPHVSITCKKGPKQDVAAFSYPSQRIQKAH